MLSFNCFSNQRYNEYLIIAHGLFGSKKSITIPYDDNFVREKKHFSGQYWGASIKAFNDLMKSRGYFLVGSNMAGNNLFFVREVL